MEEKKDSCCSTSSGCCGIKKVIVGLLIGGFIFATGMWYANVQCPMSARICPMGGGVPVAR